MNVLSNSDTDLNDNVNLIDTDLDSLSVLELSQSLCSDFEIAFSSTILFSALNIEDLSSHIENTLVIYEVDKNNSNISRKIVSSMINKIGIVVCVNISKAVL